MLCIYKRSDLVSDKMKQKGSEKFRKKRGIPDVDVEIIWQVHAVT